MLFYSRVPHNNINGCLEWFGVVLGYAMDPNLILQEKALGTFQ